MVNRLLPLLLSLTPPPPPHSATGTPVTHVLNVLHETHREMVDRLLHCFLGHLYHLARGELLRLAAMLRLAPPSSSRVLMLSRVAPFGAQGGGGGGAGDAAAAGARRGAARSGSSGGGAGMNATSLEGLSPAMLAHLQVWRAWGWVMGGRRPTCSHTLG